MHKYCAEELTLGICAPNPNNIFCTKPPVFKNGKIGCKGLAISDRTYSDPDDCFWIEFMEQYCRSAFIMPHFV